MKVSEDLKADREAWLLSPLYVDVKINGKMVPIKVAEGEHAQPLHGLPGAAGETQPMKKIPTLFRRDWEGNRSLVLPTFEVDLPAGAHATVKWDGTSVLIRSGAYFKRYDAKHGKNPPKDFMPAQPEPDPETGHWPGWVPVKAQDPADRWHIEALRDELPDGTYELIGPKVQGNPYRMSGEHELRRHGEALWPWEPGMDLAAYKAWMSEIGHEGIVWWHRGEPVAKLKRRDFGLPWPLTAHSGTVSTPARSESEQS